MVAERADNTGSSACEVSPPTSQTPPQVASARLLAEVARRLSIERFARRAERALLWLCASYCALLLASALLDLGPGFVFHPLALAVVLALALAIAALPSRSKHRAALAAARWIDARCGTRDLFLTRALLDHPAGGYEPLVELRAEQRAREIDARAVVALGLGPRVMRGAGALAVLALAILLLPLLDLGGGDPAARQRSSLQKRTAAEHRELALERAKVLKKRDVEAELSKPLLAALQELKQNLRAMTPSEHKRNEAQIAALRKDLGASWRQARAANQQAGRSGARQSFGGRRSERAAAWARDVARGDASSVRRAVEDLRERLSELPKKSADERQDARKELEDRLRELANFANEAASSPELREALARLLQQTAALDQDEISAEQLAALDQTMELSELELEALAQAMRDQTALERALEALQLAAALNELEPLDGEACSACEALEQYAAFYRKMLGEQMKKLGACSQCKGAGCGACAGTGCEGGASLAALGLGARFALGEGGRGAGMGGPGQGEGGIAPEDPGSGSEFVPERSRAALTAGRTLMSLKTTEVADTGQAVQDRDRAVQQVQQGVSEAILTENVPPGYHEAIKRYFDELGGEKPK